MASKRKHSSSTVEQKLKALKRLDSGESASKLAVEFGVGKATISDWKKNRATIEKFSDTKSHEILKRRHHVKLSVNEKIDEAVFVWFSLERQNGVPISGPQIQKKALELNKLMDGDSSFTASNGWLDRWKKRHGVRVRPTSGETLSADNTVPTEEYLHSFADFTPSEHSQQLYNPDGTGLNFKVPSTANLVPQDAIVPACSNLPVSNNLTIGKFS